MAIILGIDVGSSSTKIAVLDENKNIIAVENIFASDRVTAIYGAIGKILYENHLEISNVDLIMMTGLGASTIDGDLYGIPTKQVSEFESLGRGGLYLSSLNEGIICSIGTGTACVSAKNGSFAHVGGSAVGGGTLVGLCSRLFHIKDVEMISKMADQGDLKHVDWSINEVSSVEMATLPDYATASNLGKMEHSATDHDVALGILNLIFQTAGTMAVFACRNENMKDAVMVGTLSTLEHAKILLGRVGELYGLNFIIPEQAAFATAIGAALSGL